MKVLFVGGELDGLKCELWELPLLPQWKGEITNHPNKELDGLPIMEGYLSPMLDGGMIRYETQEVYDLLSH